MWIGARNRATPAEKHLRSLMDGESRLYVEGTLRHEPEKLTNRSRWQLRSERIWHPTGAQEITTARGGYAH